MVLDGPILLPLSCNYSGLLVKETKESVDYVNRQLEGSSNYQEQKQLFFATLQSNTDIFHEPLGAETGSSVGEGNMVNINNIEYYGTVFPGIGIPGIGIPSDPIYNGWRITWSTPLVFRFASDAGDPSWHEASTSQETWDFGNDGLTMTVTRSSDPLIASWSAQAKRTAERPMTLMSKTLSRAPDGSSDDRDKIGVGEQVHLTANFSDAEWRIELPVYDENSNAIYDPSFAGDLEHLSGSSTAEFIAGTNAVSSASISALRPNGQKITKSFRIRTPIESHPHDFLLKRIAYDSSKSGVDILFNRHMHLFPDSVSFTGIRAMESVGNPTPSSEGLLSYILLVADEQKNVNIPKAAINSLTDVDNRNDVGNKLPDDIISNGISPIGVTLDKSTNGTITWPISLYFVRKKDVDSGDSTLHLAEVTFQTWTFSPGQDPTPDRPKMQVKWLSYFDER